MPSTFAKMIWFDKTKLQWESCSYGFAEAPGYPGIYIGTNFRAMPAFEGKNLALGIPGVGIPSWSGVDLSPGTEIVVDVVWSQKHEKYFGKWCLRTEWDPMVARLKEQNRARPIAPQLAATRLFVRQLGSIKPRSLPEALRCGWTLYQGQPDDPQIVVARKGPDGRRITRTIHQPQYQSRRSLTRV